MFIEQKYNKNKGFLMFKFLKKKKKEEIDYSKMPEHVAFIMDGNGRWAKKRGKLRTYGHRIGAESITAIVNHAKKLGIKVISLFAFSTENWNRPKDEVDEIFRIAEDLIDKRFDDYVNSDIKLIVIGGREKLPKTLVEKIKNMEEKTKNNKSLTVNIALNYGGRDEIIKAVNNILKDGLKEIDEKTFRSYLQTCSIPDPDLLIRTSGEQRLSNFMMYQCAYTELYFPKVHWPDFREKELEEAVIAFQKRDRRYGAIK